MVVDETAPLHRSACRCASTNQSHLSTPRETSVKRSAVSASESSLERSISARTSLPNALRTAESASTCSRPSPPLTAYSGSDERLAATRAVPSATPPSCTARSAIRSTYSSTASFTSSNSLCRAMKSGPLTFQCACLHCVCSSLASASRALSSSTSLTRADSGRSFLVGYMLTSTPSLCSSPVQG